MRKIAEISCIWLLFFSVHLFSQTHTSVPLGNQIYYILEQAEARGLCSPLPGTKPYTQNVITGAINEILNSPNAKKLSETEQEILNRYLDQFSKPEEGIDWQRGMWYSETAIGKDDTPLSMNLGLIAEIEGSSGMYLSNDFYYGTEVWMGLFMNGDLGCNISYGLTFEGGLMRAPRNYQGEYWTYYEDFDPKENAADPSDEFVNRKIKTYSEPVTHFPYTYKKRWDGSVYSFGQLSSFGNWPQDFAGAYNLPAEITGSFFDDKLIARMGRISHEWGSTSYGSSLALNQMARPFLGIEAEFHPVSWFSMASLTGWLEYTNTGGLKSSSKEFQNMFSVTMFQFRYKNYVSFDFIDAVVYPKRFELGYISPIISNFFYQNNVGDFDNMAITLNLKAQYPGLGNIWLSLFIDEMTFGNDLWTLDRQMVAFQAGMNVPLPFLAFSSLKLSYTKVNPYCYTHTRNFTPWNGDLRMETAYVNNGVGLGYYLPPNSDEILVMFKTMPAKNLSTFLQYQLIRHGADFGEYAVDGSNLLSELGAGPTEEGRSTNPVLRRFFLHDGAYQWSHIIRLGAEWNLSSLPIALYGEAGAVISYFTNTAGHPANDGKAHPYKIINTSEYPKSTGFIVKLGFRLFPR